MLEFDFRPIQLRKTPLLMRLMHWVMIPFAPFLVLIPWSFTRFAGLPLAEYRGQPPRMHFSLGRTQFSIG